MVEEPTSETDLSSSTANTRSRSLTKRHNYALNCYDNQPLTKNCQKLPYGYYCTRLGRLAWKEEEEIICGGCSCTSKYSRLPIPIAGRTNSGDLFPAPKCFMAYSGQTVCVAQQKPYVDLSEPPTERIKQLTTLIASPSPKTETTANIESMPPTVVVRDVAAVQASQSAKASAKAPKYNNYAMSCK